MKILRLAFENVNSLAGRWTIDLTRPAYRDGLFLIAGETGAGKTTILDAITLALFGRTARVSVSESRNEVMTRGTNACSAEVEFACADGVCRAYWGQKRTREGSQFPFQRIERRLSVLRDGAWEEIPGTKDQLERKTMEFVGAESFDQFLRTAMLAQGKFDEFLSVKGAKENRERSKILEQATGTAIYSKIGDAVHRRALKARQERDALVQQRKGSLSMLLSEDGRAAQEAELAGRRTEEEALSKEVAALEAEAKWYDERRALEAEGRELAQREEALARRKALFGPEDDRAKRACAARARVPAFEKAAELDRSAAAARAEADARTEAFAAARAERARAEAAHAAARAAAQAARAGLDKMKDALAQAAELDRQMARDAVELAAAGEKRAAAEKAVKDVEDILSKGPPDMAAQLELADACKARREASSPALDAARKERDALESVRNARLGAKEAVDTEYANRRADLERAISQAQEDLVVAERVWSYEAKRRTLEEGKPCPLCGATSHPYCAGVVPRPDAYRLRLEEARGAMDELVKRRDAAQGAFEKADAGFRAAERALRALEDARRAEENRLTAEEAEHRAHAADCRARTEAAAAKLPGLKDDLARHVRSRAARQAALDGLRAARAGLGVDGDPEKVRARLQGAVDGAAREEAAAAAVLAAAQTGCEAAEKEMAGAVQAADDRAADAKRVRADFETALRADGYADVRDWRDACWNEADIRRVELERARIRSAEDGCRALRMKYGERTAAFAERKAPSREADAAARALAEGKSALARVHDAVVALASELDADGKKRAELRDLADRIAAATVLADKWGTLDAEVGGENGSNFKLYAQGITLAQLVDLGNAYLVPMTNGRYEMAWDPEGDDAERLLPTIVDWRAGGERRPVVNLSGGERFQVSLSLALGLSDLNAGTLHVETLFLDEGFGTLDEKTLDVSIATLEGIQRDGSKTIGVISHVRELDARIATKIVATKKGNGLGELSGPGVSSAPPSRSASFFSQK